MALHGTIQINHWHIGGWEAVRIEGTTTGWRLGMRQALPQRLGRGRDVAARAS